MRLLVLLGTVTTVVSMFLDNVTTVVLIAPVTILICEILGITPRPYLLAEALLSEYRRRGNPGRRPAQYPHRFSRRAVLHRFPDQFPADRRWSPGWPHCSSCVSSSDANWQFDRGR